MAACGSLQHIFDTPLSADTPRLLDPLPSWNQFQPAKPVHASSFTEIFGELHFNDTTPVSSSSSTALFDLDTQPKNKHPLLNKASFPGTTETKYNGLHKNSDSFSSMNSESLQLCTEGLGFESSGDVEDMMSCNMNDDPRNHQEKASFSPKSYFTATTAKKTRSAGAVGGFPPPISCISKSGKPWVCFKSFREDGRFVLKEIRIPTQEFLHAYREGGRLTLHFIHHEDEREDDEDEDEDEDDNEETCEEEDDDNDDQEEENGDEHADAACAVNKENEANTGTCSTNEV